MWCITGTNDVVEHELNITAVHPLTGKQLPVYVVTSRQYGEYNDVELGTLVFDISCVCLC